MNQASKIPRFNLGDVVRLRKIHPCGNTDWEIVRVGMDIRIRCLKCDHQVLIPRVKFEKAVKMVIRPAAPNGGE